MLPRGDQRALLAVSFLLIVSILIRILVEFLPGREPAGLEEFERESQILMAALSEADSLSLPANHCPLPAITNPPPSNHSSRTTTRPSPIDINRADSVQLLPLPGIGPVFAGRIIKYRELLGGFVHLDQLREVYGLPEETLELIRDQIIVDTGAIRRICLDRASFRDLLRHPYLDFEEVTALMEYRDFSSDISTLGELLQNQLLPDSTLKRIGPYLDFNCERKLK